MVGYLDWNWKYRYTRLTKVGNVLIIVACFSRYQVQRLMVFVVILISCLCMQRDRRAAVSVSAEARQFPRRADEQFTSVSPPTCISRIHWPSCQCQCGRSLDGRGQRWRQADDGRQVYCRSGSVGPSHTT